MKEYDALLFDVYRWSEHPELNELYNLLWGAIPRGKHQEQTLQKMGEYLKPFLCNLATSYYIGKPVAVPLRYSEFSSGRLGQLHFDRVPFLAVFDWLSKNELIECRKGYRLKRRVANLLPGEYTRMWPGKELQRIFDEFDWAPERIIGDCIVLKDDQKNVIDFDETKFTQELRADIGTINSIYLRHLFTHKLRNRTYLYNYYYYKGISEYNDILKNKNISIQYNIHNHKSLFISTPLREPTQKVRRFVPQIKAVFNGGNFATGGRFYANNLLGESWQNMPSSQRKTILIDNEPTVELDYDAFHINILYAVNRIQLPPDFDPYTRIAGKEMRPIVKVLFLTAINAKDDLDTIKSMNEQIMTLKGKIALSERELKFLNLCKEYDPDWKDLIGRLKKAHSAIHDSFCGRFGVLLQRIDAEIMRYIMLELAKQNIPCLPVHDSAIVAEQHEDLLRDIMDKTYRWKLNGFSCPISKK